MARHELVEQVGEFAACWTCAGAGWVVACQGCDGPGDGSCGQCRGGWADWVDVGVDRDERPDGTDTSTCPACDGDGLADLSVEMEGLLRALSEMAQALEPEGWTFSLGAEDCMTCLKGELRGAVGPFLGFHCQEADHRDRSLRVLVRGDAQDLYRLGEVAFDNVLRLYDHGDRVGCRDVQILWIPPFDEETHEGESPPRTVRQVEGPMSHDDLVEEMVADGYDRSAATMAIEAVVHAGAFEVSLDRDGKTWYIPIRDEGEPVGDDTGGPRG